MRNVWTLFKTTEKVQWFIWPLNCSYWTAPPVHSWLNLYYGRGGCLWAVCELRTSFFPKHTLVPQPNTTIYECIIFPFNVSFFIVDGFVWVVTLIRKREPQTMLQNWIWYAAQMFGLFSENGSIFSSLLACVKNVCVKRHVALTMRNRDGTQRTNTFNMRSLFNIRTIRIKLDCNRPLEHHSRVCILMVQCTSANTTPYLLVVFAIL